MDIFSENLIIFYRPGNCFRPVKGLAYEVEKQSDDPMHLSVAEARIEMVMRRRINRGMNERLPRLPRFIKVNPGWGSGLLTGRDAKCGMEKGHG